MLTVALKEWAVVCDLLLEGKCGFLLRKGGIHEQRGPGRFELEHQRFAFFPAWEHQWPDGLKPEHRARVEVFDREPPHITFRAIGVVTENAIWRIPSRAAFDALEDLHPWAEPQVDMRFNYKPDRPLYLICPRVFRLPQPRTVVNRDTYRGCRSWVPLDGQDTLDDAGAQPVLSESVFLQLCHRIAEALH